MPKFLYPYHVAYCLMNLFLLAWTGEMWVCSVSDHHMQRQGQKWLPYIQWKWDWFKFW